MIPEFPLIVQDLNSLHLDIHTIGYPNEGETLLTLLCDGDKVLFSVLTDCYEYLHYNHAKKLLNRLQVKQIDAFIWTHPDKDHSIGIPDFLAKFDPHHKAEIFMPFVNKRMGLKQKAKEALDYVTKNYNSHRKYDINYVQLHKPKRNDPPLPLPLMSLKINVVKPQTEINLSYFFILPNDNVVNRVLSSDNPLLNDLSIVYFITFNDVSFFFCGDLSERNIKFISPDFLKNSVFIKIPHHGSDDDKSSFRKSFIPMFRSQGIEHAISTTTVFKCQNLPKVEVLNEYKTISDGVYCTSNIQHKEQIDRYGCITAKFSANMEKPQIMTTGNAYCFYSA